MLKRNSESINQLFTRVCKNGLNLFNLKSIAFSTSYNACSKKHICFSDYDAIGFDCDHTLAQYHLHYLFKDTFCSLADFLNEKKGYQREIFEFIPEFCSKGLILDLKKGNFLKLAHDGKILRASHGTKFIKNINKHFSSSIWPHHEKLSQTMTNIGSRYRIFENFFDMASGLLCAQIIDHLNLTNNNKSFYNVWADVEDAIHHVYIPDPFRATNGMFFHRFLKETDRYAERWSVERKNWLKKLKYGRSYEIEDSNSIELSVNLSENSLNTVDDKFTIKKPLFVLSSAYEDFAAATMAFTFGEDWEDYFDFGIFLANKPSFFKCDRPFYHLVYCDDGKIETRPANDLSNDTRFHGGNLNQLQKHLREITNKDSPKVLFFGDSLRSDIIPSKKYAGWDTVYILEEMASERCFHKPRPNNLKVEVCDVKNNERLPWGSVLVDFEHNNGKSKTMLHYAVQKYADIAVPNLEFLHGIPHDYKFETFNPNANFSSSGFHPFIPKIF